MAFCIVNVHFKRRNPHAKKMYWCLPYATTVYATYDGFSSRPNTWAYMTETDENGVAYVKLHHPGIWMIRAENKIDQATEDYNTQVIRSVLVFNVK